MKQPIERKYLHGRKELSAYTGIGTRTISRLMVEGKIPYKRIGHNMVIFRISEVDAALAVIGEGE